MSIWKELTNPTSFAGQYDTVVEPVALTDKPQRPNGSLGIVGKKESVIGPGVVIEGTIEGDGDLRIAGRVKGDVRLKGNLTLESGARIVGGVSAENVALGGAIEGNIQASGNVKLVETGQLVGDLKAKYMVAALGSRMRGNVEFGWDEPMVKPVEKITKLETHEAPFVGPPRPK